MKEHIETMSWIRHLPRKPHTGLEKVQRDIRQIYNLLVGIIIMMLTMVVVFFNSKQDAALFPALLIGGFFLFFICYLGILVKKRWTKK